MIELEVLGGVARGQLLKTNAPTISIGRSPEHTIVVADRSVSRHHGEIVLVDNCYQYRDLNSTHGTMLRRGADESFIKQAVLHEGDELVLGPTDNVLRILRVMTDAVEMNAIGLTMMHQPVDAFGPPEKVFANDSKALRIMVQFDTRLMESRVTTERRVFEELLSHIPELFENLNYVAVIEDTEEGLRPLDFRLLSDRAKLRLSSNLAELAHETEGAFMFRIRDEGTIESGHDKRSLSDNSLIEAGDLPSLNDISGICAPLSAKTATPVRYLVLERQVTVGLLNRSDVTLVGSLAARVRDRIENIALVRQNQILNANAALGVFAGMIGHDIKNYLFFGKKLSDIRDDTLSSHPGILKGIERSRKLAQSMKDLAAPGNVNLKTFSVEELARSVAEEFGSLFGADCGFSVEVRTPPPPITTSEELLYRVVWNLVMNAYHTAENKRAVLKESPWVRIDLDTEGEDRIVLELSDNAGGIGPRTLGYMQESFDLIRKVHSQEEDLITVVNAISRMEGFTNSVGLFFTGVAVNDMHGTITVTTEARKGSTFRIVLPRTISGLKRLLRF